MARRQALIAVVLLIVGASSVWGAATIADIYQAPNEAYTYSGATNDTCEDMETSGECSDEQYTTVADQYTPLGDGSTAASSGATADDRDSGQSTFLKLQYSVDGVLPGFYTFRFHTTATSAFNYRVYEYINDTHVNETSYLEGSFNPDDGSWAEVELNGFVSNLAQEFNNFVPIRFVVIDGNTTDSATVTEAYLKRPFTGADFGVVPTGVGQVNLDAIAENTWLVTSRTDVVSSPEITNLTCEFSELTALGEEIVRNLSYSTKIESRGFSVYWHANSSKNVTEGDNIEVDCDVRIGGVYFSEVKQYVYINPDLTILDRLQQILTNVLTALGILQETQISELNVFDSLTVDIAQVSGYPGQEKYVTVVASTDRSPINDAACILNGYSQSGQWMTNESMSALGYDGIYSANVTLPSEIGNQRVVAECTGGVLNATTVRGTTTWSVFDGIRMESIT